MIYMKIQTNRAKIKDLLSQFSVNHASNEKFIAPRPLPRENFKFYIGYTQVKENSKNHQLLKKVKNHSLLDEVEYQSLVNDIEYSWQSPKASV